MKQTILILHFQNLKKSEVASYITLPCDQRGIVGYIMWEYDWLINKVMEREW